MPKCHNFNSFCTELEVLSAAIVYCCIWTCFSCRILSDISMQLFSIGWCNWLLYWTVWYLWWTLWNGEGNGLSNSAWICICDFWRSLHGCQVLYYCTWFIVLVYLILKLAIGCIRLLCNFVSIVLLLCIELYWVSIKETMEEAK